MLVYILIMFIEGFGCGTFTACIYKAAYPNNDAPWYVWPALLFFAITFFNKIKTKY